MILSSSNDQQTRDFELVQAIKAKIRIISPFFGVGLIQLLFKKRKNCVPKNDLLFVAGGLNMMVPEKLKSLEHLLRWPNTVSAPSAVLCKSRRSF